MKIIKTKPLKEADYTNVNTVLPEYDMTDPHKVKGKQSSRGIDLEDNPKDKDFLEDSIIKFCSLFRDHINNTYSYYPSISVKLRDYFYNLGYIFNGLYIYPINKINFNNLVQDENTLSNENFTVNGLSYEENIELYSSIDVINTKYGILKSGIERYTDFLIFHIEQDIRGGRNKKSNNFSKLYHKLKNTNSEPPEDATIIIDIKPNGELENLMLSNNNVIDDILSIIDDKEFKENAYKILRNIKTRQNRGFSKIEPDEQIPQELKDKQKQASQSLRMEREKHNIPPVQTEPSKRFSKLDMNEKKMKLKITNIIKENTEPPSMNVIHWMPHSLVTDPSNITLRPSKNVFGKKQITGLWCVPYGINSSLNTMWCTGEYKDSLARDIGVVISTPIQNLQLYKMGSPIKSTITPQLAASLCRDDDNGLILKSTDNCKILKILFGQWSNNKLTVEEIDSSFFK